MRLHFDRNGVRRLVEHARASTAHRATFGETTPPAPALWLVGDEGVYLISNGEPHLPSDSDPKRSFVVYARECDPTKLEFDRWWETKRDSFGGDDGAECLGLDEIEAALKTYAPDSPLMLEVTPQKLAIIAYVAQR